MGWCFCPSSVLLFLTNGYSYPSFYFPDHCILNFLYQEVSLPVAFPVDLASSHPPSSGRISRRSYQDGGRLRSLPLIFTSRRSFVEVIAIRKKEPAFDRRSQFSKRRHRRGAPYLSFFEISRAGRMLEQSVAVLAGVRLHRLSVSCVH